MTTITTMTTYTTQPQRVGALVAHHPGWVITPVGPGGDTHGTLGPLRRKAVGGPINARQGEVTHDDGALKRDNRQVFRQTILESSCSCFSRLEGFFGFILALRATASNDSSFSSFPISTSSRGASIGSSGARSVFRVFVTLSNELLCHTRFLAAENFFAKFGFCGLHFCLQIEI